MAFIGVLYDGASQGFWEAAYEADPVPYYVPPADVSPPPTLSSVGAIAHAIEVSAGIDTATKPIVAVVSNTPVKAVVRPPVEATARTLAARESTAGRVQIDIAPALTAIKQEPPQLALGNTRFIELRSQIMQRVKSVDPALDQPLLYWVKESQQTLDYMRRAEIATNRAKNAHGRQWIGHWSDNRPAVQPFAAKVPPVGETSRAYSNAAALTKLARARAEISLRTAGRAKGLRARGVLRWRPGDWLAQTTDSASTTDSSVPAIAFVDPTAAESPTLSDDPNKWSFYAKQVYIFQYLQYWADIPPEAAAGLLGNFIQESRLDQSYKFPWGIVQWRGIRIDRLKEFAKHHPGDASDFLTQVAFVVYELKRWYPNTLKALQHDHSSDDAARIVFEVYEAPGDKSLPDRQQKARDVMDLYKQGRL